MRRPKGIGVRPILLPIYVLLVALVSRTVAAGEAVDWPVTGGDPGGMRYSPLRQIDRSNVGDLDVVWTYRHGDYRSGWPDPFRGTSFEATPIVVDRRLLFTTPFDRLIALDPETGRELWTFDPKIDKNRRFGNLMVNRGVANWRGRSGAGRCDRRVFLATLDARLIALDAANGQPCDDFGHGGTVDLLEGIENVGDPWEHNVTSPWGMLHAVDLNTCEIRWQVPIGQDSAGNRGLVNFGPLLVTAGGLVFEAGTTKRLLRAHDSSTGEVLATFELPAGLHAGPISYQVGGKQFLVIAPGGHARLGSRLGDYLVAYALRSRVASQTTTSR
jgi:glucose dehydrogenase